MKFKLIKRIFSQIGHNFKKFFKFYTDFDESWTLRDVFSNWNKRIINNLYTIITTGLFIGFAIFCFIIKFNNPYLTFVFRVIGIGLGWKVWEMVDSRFIQPKFPLMKIEIRK